MGVTYVSVDVGGNYVAALRSDGQIVAWGDNFDGQCNIPPLPPGVTYLSVSAGLAHTAAKRSDGTWLAWGRNEWGQSNIPAAAAGTLVDVQCGWKHTIGLRSNGLLESWGSYSTPTPLPTGETFRDLGALWGGAFTVSSDGYLQTVLSVAPGPPPPQLPLGIRYVACDSGWNFGVGLGSDGMIRAWGSNPWGQLNVPPLASGVTYVQADAGVSAVALHRHERSTLRRSEQCDDGPSSVTLRQRQQANPREERRRPFVTTPEQLGWTSVHAPGAPWAGANPRGRQPPARRCNASDRWHLHARAGGRGDIPHVDTYSLGRKPT
jgi:alpha-tubulin suppressor-like RCC1 family protein